MSEEPRFYPLCITVWTKNLSLAPKVIAPNQRLIGWLESDGGTHIEQIHWEAYPEIDVEEYGEGYWTESEGLINMVTGGIEPDRIEDYWWAVIELPKV